MEDVVSQKEIDSLLCALDAMEDVEILSKEEIDALMGELIGDEKVEKTGTAYNPTDRTGGYRARDERQHLCGV